MKTKSLRGRDFISTLEFTNEELESILELAALLKADTASGREHLLLLRKTLFAIFYNKSLRTRNSFEVGMTQLGGHANYLDSEKIYTPAIEGEEKAYSTERISDVARVLASYGDGIAIRMYGKATGWKYGNGNRYIREFAKWANVPVINMEDDIYHPCQSMTDVFTMKEKLGTLRNKKLVVSWAYSPSVEKPVAVPQSLVATASRFGMNIILARPDGFQLDPMIIDTVKENSKKYGGSFEETDSMEDAFKGADVLYPKSWGSLTCVPPQTPEINVDQMKTLFEKNKSWICDDRKLKLAKPEAIYMHCLPCDRGYEVTDSVVDGPNSVVFEEAENRLHVQKAIMALLMR